MGMTGAEPYRANLALVLLTTFVPQFNAAAEIGIVNPSVEFADALETCIRNAAAEAAASFSDWGNTCMPPTHKIDIQASILKRTLASIRDRYGYSGALWCAFYSLVSSGCSACLNAKPDICLNVFRGRSE